MVLKEQYINKTGKRLNLIGKRYGKLIVLNLSHLHKESKHSYWKCRCDCGKVKVITGRDLTRKRYSTMSCGCSRKFPKGVAGLHLIYRSYKRSAKRRNINFQLSLNELKILTSKKCQYCGISPNKSAQKSTSHKLNGDYIYNGIDRVDNNIGYIITNCIPYVYETMASSYKKAYHEKWKLKDKMINVSVEQWNYYPVHLNTIIDIISGK